MAARRAIEPGKDPIEWLYDQGYSDGFPCVPPTPERVAYMLKGTDRSLTEVGGMVACVCLRSLSSRLAAASPSSPPRHRMNIPAFLHT